MEVMVKESLRSVDGSVGDVEVCATYWMLIANRYLNKRKLLYIRLCSSVPPPLHPASILLPSSICRCS